MNVASCHPPVSLYQQGCAQFFYPPACIDNGSCHDPVARPCAWICRTSGGSPGLTAWSCLGSLWMASHPSGMSSWCHPQTCWGCIQSLCQCHGRRYESVGPSADPWGAPPVTDLHPDVKPLTTTLWVRSCKQFLIHETMHLSNPYRSSLERRILWWTVSKALLKNR